MNIRLSFLGAARNVTGSRYLIEYNGSRVLVDCGLYQEREYRERNWAKFPVPPESIDTVLLTHAHLDHSGYLPRFVADGFEGRIHCTPATAEIARIALMDAAHLMVEDAEFKKHRHELEGREAPHPELPLYTEKDALETLPRFSGVKYESPVEIADGIQATFVDAGHILGSSTIALDLKAGGATRRIVFSGDIGRWDKPILNDPEVPEGADYVVMESTYGDRTHEDRADVESMLEEVIRTTRENRGNILIPSFAIERAQEVLYRLNTLLLEKRIPHMMVLIDSPMAVKVTEVFKRHSELYDEEMTELVREGHSPFRFPSLKMISSVDESKAINNIKGSVIVIAGSGMCTGGRIKHHLVNNIARPESTILFVGFQAAGTLGREIVKGAREVRVLGKSYPVKARVIQIHGFSAHADRTELQRWISRMKASPRRVFVTHGEPEAALALADLLKQENGLDVSVPEFKQSVDLE